MDNPVPAAQPTTPPMNPAPQTNAPTKSGKKNWTTLVIAFIIILAVLITGGTYFIVSQKRSNTPTAVANPTPTPIPTIQKGLWEKYTDEKNGYSFNYPDTWILTPSSDPSQFELTFSKTATPAKVKGGFLTKDAANKITAKECGTNTSTKTCNTYGLTASSKIYLHITMTNNLPSSEDIFITRPNDEGIYFNITQSDPEAYQIVPIILNSIRFANEPRLVKLRVCPDSVSADNKTITYFGATFTADEVDQEYIKTECKK